MSKIQNFDLFGLDDNDGAASDVSERLPAPPSPEAIEALKHVARLATACISRQGQLGFIADKAIEALALSGSTAADMHVASTVRRVVEQHDVIALDDEGDRETLIAALTAALANNNNNRG